jgi:rhodanese-related sulfurtransferase
MAWTPSAEPPPAKSAAERLLRANFNAQRWRNPAGAPMVSAEFVSEAGRRIKIIDVRTVEEIVGPLGYVPGSYWVPAERIAELAQRLSPSAFVVLVSRGGERSALLAQYLEMLGMRFVAALEGGIREWKLKGLVTRRDEVLRARTLDVMPTADAFADDDAPRERKILTLEDVRTHIGDPGSVRWLKLATMVVNGKQSCVDGRDDHGVLGSPGGNAGEFLLSLAAIEEATRSRIDARSIPALLDAYIDGIGRFYMHTDTHALNAMIMKLRAEPGIQHLLPPLPGLPEHWRKWTSNPPHEVRPLLRELLLVPEHIGCGHLRRTLTMASEYGVREELTRAFVLSLYELYWAGATSISIEVLGGHHDEGAVVSVVVDEEPLHAFSRVPLVSPAGDVGQMFLNTPQVAGYLRDEATAFFMQRTDLVPLRREHERRYQFSLSERAAAQAASTLGALAAGLPRYEVRFHDEESFSVCSRFNGSARLYLARTRSALRSRTQASPLACTRSAVRTSGSAGRARCRSTSRGLRSPARASRGRSRADRSRTRCERRHARSTCGPRAAPGRVARAQDHTRSSRAAALRARRTGPDRRPPNPCSVRARAPDSD